MSVELEIQRGYERHRRRVNITFAAVLATYFGVIFGSAIARMALGLPPPSLGWLSICSLIVAPFAFSASWLALRHLYTAKRDQQLLLARSAYKTIKPHAYGSFPRGPYLPGERCPICGELRHTSVEQLVETHKMVWSLTGGWGDLEDSIALFETIEKVRKWH